VIAHPEHLRAAAGGVAAALCACAALLFLLLQALQTRFLLLANRVSTLVSLHSLHLRLYALLAFAAAVVTSTTGKITSKMITIMINATNSVSKWPVKCLLRVFASLGYSRKFKFISIFSSSILHNILHNFSHTACLHVRKASEQIQCTSQPLLDFAHCKICCVFHNGQARSIGLAG